MGAERRGAGSGSLWARPSYGARGLSTSANANAKFAPREFALVRVRWPPVRSRANQAAVRPAVQPPSSTGREDAEQGVLRAGSGAATSRRCRMAAEPQPSSLSYRTTGSTCLHPLSELLGIPLDQPQRPQLPGDRGRGAGETVIRGPSASMAYFTATH
ncbi:hypothetical protein P7K49_007238 [Saguinus oedipus]|uniref:Uncharacterized protein n=1 Tax=Saguinus oedipus TaxID=9490 RepID=A0ABQ9VXU8_SAGOE|nr:hypothetical protein P7K49_007238 [Saguinus oedipus]